MFRRPAGKTERLPGNCQLCRVRPVFCRIGRTKKALISV
jgi:hypothetical protein